MASERTVFIPGATSGIGLGLAVRLVERGDRVIVGGRRADRLREIQSSLPRVDTVLIDVTEAASVQRAAGEVIERHPDLDMLIAMAGIMLPEDLRDPRFLPIAEETVATNLLGTIRLVAAFVPHLLTRPNAEIVTVSSGLAFVPLPLTPTYNATKAAIHSFTQSLRVQLSGSVVRVRELVPPGVRTTLMNQQDSPTSMPLDAFLDETMRLLDESTDNGELVVGDAAWLRNAEAEGRHQEALLALSGGH